MKIWMILSLIWMTKSLEDFCLLTNCVSKRIKNETKNKGVEKHVIR